MAKKFYSVDEAARLLETTPRTIRNWVIAGRIKALQVSAPGGRWKIYRDQPIFADLMEEAKKNLDSAR